MGKVRKDKKRQGKENNLASLFIAKSVLVLQKESGDIDNIKPWMIKIVCDRKIDKYEKRDGMD